MLLPAPVLASWAEGSKATCAAEVHYLGHSSSNLKPNTLFQSRIYLIGSRLRISLHGARVEYGKLLTKNLHFAEVENAKTKRYAKLGGWDGQDLSHNLCSLTLDWLEKHNDRGCYHSTSGIWPNSWNHLCAIADCNFVAPGFSDIVFCVFTDNSK